MRSTDATWLTRQQAAEYLQVSIRQLTELRLPRSMLNSSPRYSRIMLDEYLEARSFTPTGKRRKGGSSPPFRFRPSPVLVSVNTEEQIDRMKATLRQQSRRRSKRAGT